MSNVSALFENLMTYNEIHKNDKNEKKKVVTENDTTLLNLTVEIPENTEEITPEDVKVNVGVMNVFQDEDVPTEDSKKEIDTTSDESDDVTPEDETVDNETEKKDDTNKEESLNLRKEAIRQKRLEAKALREAKKNEEKKDCTGKEDCTCESCKAKLESTSDEEVDSEIEESTDVETAKANIRKRVAANECTTKKESLMHLDTKSLNKLFTEFVKENYKNIDKVVITKAMLENRMLKLEGVITNISGESTNISLTNRGFNPAKLENKRFIMDFKDTSGTFSVVKESLKQPFVFTCTLKEGILSFEELKYSYKTMIESNMAEVSGKCTLMEGLFDGKTKEFVKKEFNNLSDLGNAAMSDDGLGFRIETKDVEKLKSAIKTAGYKETNDGDFYRVVDKQKILVTFRMDGSLTSNNQTHIVNFSARKEDVKQIKEGLLKKKPTMKTVKAQEIKVGDKILPGTGINPHPGNLFKVNEIDKDGDAFTFTCSVADDNKKLYNQCQGRTFKFKYDYQGVEVVDYYK